MVISRLERGKTIYHGIYMKDIIGLFGWKLNKQLRKKGSNFENFIKKTLSVITLQGATAFLEFFEFNIINHLLYSVDVALYKFWVLDYIKQRLSYIGSIKCLNTSITRPVL